MGYKNLDTADKKIKIHVTWSEKSSNQWPRKISGYAIDATSGIRIDGSKVRKIIAKNPAELELKERILVNRLMNAIRPATTEKTVKNNNSDINKSLYAKAFQELKNSGEIISSSWSKSTEKSRMMYFERNMLHYISANGDAWEDSNKDEVFAILTNKILKTRKSNGILSDATDTAISNLTFCQVIYDRMRDINNLLPEIALMKKRPRNRNSREQLKSLPQDVRRKFIAEIIKLSEKNPQMAIPATAMFVCGLRTAEACALSKYEILFTSNVNFITVQWQIKDGVRTKILKTDNAYRNVPLGIWGSHIIQICLDRIELLENTEMYVNPDKLSAFIKKTLIEDCGMTQDYLHEAELAMRNQPEQNFEGNDSNDISAYILRRDWSSRARMICGITSEEIDYLLGHNIKIPLKRRKDYSQIESLSKLSYSLEHFVFDPNHSLHPGCTPFEVCHSADLELEPFDVIKIKNVSNELINVKFDIEARLNCDRILIISPRNSNLQHTLRSIKTHCQRLDEPLIGSSNIKLEEEINELY